MKKLELVRPGPEYLQSYLTACIEQKEHNVPGYTLHDPDTFDSWKHTIFDEFLRQEKGFFLNPAYVSATTLWTVMDGQFIGTGNIRHRLTPALERFGGHIGYAIRPSCWGFGLGTRQLALLLQRANKMGINPALITCNIENIGSQRVIEKNGGLFIDTVPNRVNGQDIVTCRYWVKTSDITPQ